MRLCNPGCGLVWWGTAGCWPPLCICRTWCRSVHWEPCRRNPGRSPQRLSLGPPDSCLPNFSAKHKSKETLTMQSNTVPVGITGFKGRENTTADTEKGACQRRGRATILRLFSFLEGFFLSFLEGWVPIFKDKDNSDNDHGNVTSFERSTFSRAVWKLRATAWQSWCQHDSYRLLHFNRVA